MTNQSRKSHLFLTRGNELQIFDFDTEKVIKTFKLNVSETHLKIKSYYSPLKTLYIVRSKKDFYIVNSSTYDQLMYHKINEGTLEELYFLNKTDIHFVYVTKKG